MNQTDHRKNHVLVIDDDPLIREFLAMLLEDEGYSMLVAEDGVEGIKVFRAHAPQICAVILDLIMPNMDGVAAFRELVTIRSDVPVIIASGSMYHSIHDIEHNGIHPAGFLHKPYVPEDLIQMIQGLSVK